MSGVYQDILRLIAENKSITLRTELTGTEGPVRGALSRSLTDVFPVEDAHGNRYARVTVASEGETMTIEEPVFPRERLIVLGGGHISVPTCEIAARCGFSVVVIDDREEFANKERFPDASETICDSYQDALKRLKLTSYDYVVIVTRGHKCDTESLRTVLLGPRPAYVGMIGSKKRVKDQLELLKSEGISEERLSQVCTPIGLRIGAVTPAEIAVSILSEVISYRRLNPDGEKKGLINDTDEDLATLSFLAEHMGPKAVVTILDTKGSSPRKAGARMVVGPEGLLAGSVGGGVAEGVLIRQAMELIGSGRFQVKDFDLDGTVPQADWMVCGGWMQVLLEDASE